MPGFDRIESGSGDCSENLSGTNSLRSPRIKTEVMRLSVHLQEAQAGLCEDISGKRHRNALL